MNILVVEDEVQLADTLAEILKRNKYNVDTVFDGDDGLEYARTGIYDCILLDIMLPVRSGTEIVRILRQEKNATPIMLLTAKSEVEDKIHGLDCGADDYLTKPFSTGELLARIRALTRRKGEVEVDCLHFGDSLSLPHAWSARPARTSPSSICPAASAFPISPSNRPTTFTPSARGYTLPTTRSWFLPAWAMWPSAPRWVAL